MTPEALASAPVLAAGIYIGGGLLLVILVVLLIVFILR
jgi:hypothetical protein